MGSPTLRHRRAVQPLHFPDSEPEELRVPEGKIHVPLKTMLHAILAHAYAREHTLGCDQFVYFNARDPNRKCAPDVFVKLGMPDTMFRSWKVWERGAPDLAVEIDCSDDGKRLVWDERFGRLWEAGVRELVRFMPEAPEGHRLRVWDRLEDDFVERVVEGDVTPCVTLGVWWVVRSADPLGPALRAVRDAAGSVLLPTPTEAERELREAESRAREVAERGRKAAEGRIAELEAELRRRS